MIEEYKIGQPVFYKTLTNAINKNRLSHAYLIEVNDNNDTEKIILSFVKAIFCPEKKTKSDNCKDCYICKRIDESNYSELKIIYPDGLWIKKGQLLELQEEFSKKAVESDKKVYVIYDCEKLNRQASNSILKFLEEPENGIIAILVTKNINLLLKTIVSRCQVITLNKNNKESRCDDKIKKDVIDFIKYYEENKNKAIVVSNTIWHDKFKEKDIVIQAMDMCVQFYSEVLNHINGKRTILFLEEKDVVIKIANMNKEKDIIKKIKVFMANKELIKYNINGNLLCDKMIIELGGE